MHLWHTTVGAPPTRDRLSRLCLMTLIEETSYVLYDHSIESPIHLFWNCQVARALWFGSEWKVKTDAIFFQSWEGLIDGF